MTEILIQSASTLHPDDSVRPKTYGVTKVEGDDSFSTHRIYLDGMSTESGNYFTSLYGAVCDYVKRCEKSVLVPVISENEEYYENTIKQDNNGRVVETPYGYRIEESFSVAWVTQPNPPRPSNTEVYDSMPLDLRSYMVDLIDHLYTPHNIASDIVDVLKDRPDVTPEEVEKLEDNKFEISEKVRNCMRKHGILGGSAHNSE